MQAEDVETDGLEALASVHWRRHCDALDGLDPERAR